MAFIFRDSNGKLDEPWNEIVDGKQRLSTIVDFLKIDSVIAATCMI